MYKILKIKAQSERSPNRTNQAEQSSACHAKSKILLGFDGVPSKQSFDKDSAGPHHKVVLVKPNARKTEILEEKGDKLKVAVAAPAESGKANLELIKFLKKKFGSEVKIIRGKTSKKKIIKLG